MYKLIASWNNGYAPQDERYCTEHLEITWMSEFFVQGRGHILADHYQHFDNFAWLEDGQYIRALTVQQAWSWCEQYGLVYGMHAIKALCGESIESIKPIEPIEPMELIEIEIKDVQAVA